MEKAYINERDISTDFLYSYFFDNDRYNERHSTAHSTELVGFWNKMPLIVSWNSQDNKIIYKFVNASDNNADTKNALITELKEMVSYEEDFLNVVFQDIGEAIVSKYYFR